MGLGAVLEPLSVVVLLFGGAWINRSASSSHLSPRTQVVDPDEIEKDDHLLQGTVEKHLQSTRSSEETASSPAPSSSSLSEFDPEDKPLSPSLLPQQELKWRNRQLRAFKWTKTLRTPNTARFRNTWMSRTLARFPFLVECWYWALVYWTYQIGRAISALTLEQDTVDVARYNAIDVVKLEQRLHIFVEPAIQSFFLSRPTLLQWTNWLYSFIHIPGTIAFLVWLYYYTTTLNRSDNHGGCPAGPGKYQAVRRALGTCNLLAFVVFTSWPCMPPRLLADPTVEGAIGEQARSYGFVDTVHQTKGASSVWTQNKFCNQYAAMPSLHFGYSLLIGLTIMTIPLREKRQSASYLPLYNRTSIRDPSSSSTSSSPTIPMPHALLPSEKTFRRFFPSTSRLLCVTLGALYPMAILTAIVATANHFILDAVAGAIVCGISWWINEGMSNLLPLEDWLLWAVRCQKPEIRAHYSHLSTHNKSVWGLGKKMDKVNQI